MHSRSHRYRRRIYVTGALYFHGISSHITGTALKNLHLFESLCGEDFNKIVLTTTMWDNVDEKTGYDREIELRNSYWKAMVERGSSIRHFLLTRASAFEVLEPILVGVRNGKPLLLQREIEDLGLRLNQTRTGRALFLQLEELVGVHEEKLNRIRSELKEQLTPQELDLLTAEYRQISVQIQNSMNDAKRLNSTTPKQPGKLRQTFK